MANKDRYLVGLDIGSTKTCALIGEQADDGVKFLALGATDSKGLRKGLIVNLDATVGSIRRAVEEAESAAGVPVESALIGVAGSHVHGVNSRGVIALGQRARDVQREDVRRAVDAARSVTLPEDRAVFHVLPQGFFLDAPENIREAALVHLPLYLCKYDFNQRHYTAIVDAASSKVFANIYPAKWEVPYVSIGVAAFVAFFVLSLLSLFVNFGIFLIGAPIMAILFFSLAVSVSAKV